MENNNQKPTEAQKEKIQEAPKVLEELYKEIEPEIPKIADLDISDVDKAALTFLIQPKTLAQLIDKLGYSSSHWRMKLDVWEVRKWVFVNRGMGRKTRFGLTRNLQP